VVGSSFSAIPMIAGSGEIVDCGPEAQCISLPPHSKAGVSTCGVGVVISFDGCESGKSTCIASHVIGDKVLVLSSLV
jgi:hypothetical protein